MNVQRDLYVTLLNSIQLFCKWRNSLQSDVVEHCWHRHDICYGQSMIWEIVNIYQSMLTINNFEIEFAKNWTSFEIFQKQALKSSNISSELNEGRFLRRCYVIELFSMMMIVFEEFWSRASSRIFNPFELFCKFKRIHS